MFKKIIRAALKIAAVSTGISFLTGSFVKGMFVKKFFTYTALLGLNAITAKGTNNTSGKNLGLKAATTNPVAPRNVVYGKTRVGGTIVHRAVSGANNNKLHNVIAIAAHEINAIKKLYIDGGKGVVELDFSSDFATATENGATVYRVTNSAFTNTDNDASYTGGSLIKLVVEKGEQTTSNGYAVAQMAEWTTDHKLQGIAYVYINCIFDTEKFASYPSFSFEVEGKKVYDPVTTTTAYSTNPSLIIRDYLMDATYGFGATSDEINDAATGAGFVKARSDCNDDVTITSGTEDRYTLNGQFDMSEEPQQVLQHMLSACAGQLIYNNGKFSLFVGKERTASGTITDDNLLAPIQITTKASGQDLANGVKATYVRPTDRYIAAEITPYKDSTYLSADTPSGEQSANYENFIDVTFPYTQSTFTAQRLARIALDYQRQDQTLQVIVPIEFMTHQVGDIVNFTNTRLGYDGKDFEIVAMDFEFMADDYLALRLNLKEYSATVFNNISYVADPTLPSPPSAGDNTVATPTGLTLTEASKNTTAKEIYVRAVWTNANDDKIDWTEVAYKKSTDTEFDAAIVGYPRKSFSFRAESATTYNIKVRHGSNNGVHGDYTGVVNITTSADVGTFTTGTIAGITVESDKLYEGTGTFNNSNTGFYLDNTGQFSLKDKLSFNGTTLNISGNLTVENTISANKIVVDGINLDNLISASTQAGSIYLTEFTGIKIATAGGTSGYPPLLRLQDDQGTNTFTDITQTTQLNIRARNNTAKGKISFQGVDSGGTPVNYGGFDASGNFEIGLTDVIDASRNLNNLESIVMPDNKVIKIGTDLDLQLLHDGSNSIIKNVATGNLIIRNIVDDGDIILQSDDGSGGITNYITLDGSEAQTKFGQDAKFGDSKILKFGNSNDLQIFHDGSNSFVKDAGTGFLSLITNGSDIRLVGNAGSDFMARFNSNGSVQLYHDNSKKFETTSTGIDVTGNATISGDLTVSGTTTTVDTTNTNVKDNNLTLNYSTGDSSSTANGAGLTIQDAVSASTDATILWDATNDEFDFSHGINISGSSNFNNALTIQGTTTFNDDAIFVNDALFGDNDKAIFGAGSDLQIYHDGNHSYIQDSGTGRLRFQASTQIDFLNGAGTETLANFIENDAVKLYFNNALKLATTSTGIDVTGVAVVDGLTSSAAITSTSNSNSLGGTTFTSAVSGTSLSLSASITASGNSNSFGNSSFGTISSGDITSSGKATVSELEVDNDSTFNGGIDATGQTITSGAITTSGELLIARATPSIHFFDSNDSSDGYIQANAGTLAFFADDNNEVSNSIINFSIDGSEKMRLDTSGRLGIGVSPSYPLEVAGAGTVSIAYQRTGVSAKKWGFHSDNSNTYWQNITDNILALTVANGGNIGVGTISPAQKLHVEGNLRLQSTFPKIEFVDTDNNPDFTIIGGNGRLGFFDETNSSERMRIDSSGRVLIGTTSSIHSSADLQIVGASSNFARVALKDSDGTNQITFLDSANGDFGIVSQNGSSRGTISLKQYDGSTTSTPLRIDNSGRTGLGTISPADKLHVVGNIRTVGSTYGIRLDSSSGAGPILEFGTSSNLDAYGTIGQQASQFRFVTFGRDFNFNNNGTTNLHIDVSEVAVGINTSSPTSKLNIDTGSDQGIAIFRTGTNANFDAIQFRKSNNSDLNSRIGFNSNQLRLDGTSDILFGIGSGFAEKMRLNSTGLGIGTTSPAEKLHVVGQASFENAGNVNRGNIILGPHGNGTAKWATLAGTHFNDETGSGNGSGAAGCMIIGLNTSSGGNEVYVGGGPYELNPATAIRFYTHGTNLHNLGGSERMRLDSSGRLGINTTSPSEKLHIDGNIRFTGSLKPDGFNAFEVQSSTIFVGDRDDNDLVLDLTGFSESTGIEMNDGFMRFKSQGAEKIRMADDGDLLIGKTANNSAATGVEARNGGLFVATRASAVVGIFNRTTSDGVAVQFRKNNTVVGQINVTSSATSYNTTSDARLKDVTGYARGLKVINKLNPVAFNWKADGKADEGLIAQEVEKIVPNAVNKEDDLYQMDYSKLVVHLIKAVQEQQEEIEKLKEEVKLYKQN